MGRVGLARRLDGVVLLDPVGLQGLLEAAAANLPLPDDPEPSSASTTESGSRVRSIRDGGDYETHGFGRSDLATGRCARSAMRRSCGSSTAAGSRAMARAVVAAAAERHLQVFSSDPDAQASLQGVGVTCNLDLPATTGRFAVTANNVVGGSRTSGSAMKSASTFALDDVRLAEDGELVAGREVSIVSTVDNAGRRHDPYIIGNCYVPGRVNRCFEGEPGNNRTWFSVWASPLLLFDGFRERRRHASQHVPTL
jgi:hypothetical protein